MLPLSLTCSMIRSGRLSRSAVLLLSLMCYQMHFSCNYCVITENLEASDRRQKLSRNKAGAKATCHSSILVSAEDIEVVVDKEVISKYKRKPTSPPSDEDTVESWRLRLAMHRKNISPELENEGETVTTEPVVVNHFDLQQFPPRRIMHRKTSAEIAEEELQKSLNFGCPCDPSNNSHRPQREGTRFAYLVSVHNYRTAQDATYLYRAIRDTGHPGAAPIILIHIDKKFAWQEFQQTSLYHQTAVINCTCSSITHVASIYDSEWAQWSMNYPTHWAMRLLITDARFAGKWDVFINISGDSMPTLTQRALSDLFHPVHGPLRNINFVTSSACETGLVPTSVYDFPGFWHKRKHYMSNRRQGPTISYVDYIIDDGRTLVEGEKVKNITIYFGSQWMSLQQDFVEYVVKSLDRKDSFPSQLKKWLQDTGKLMTDETFIPTIVMNVYPYNQTVPKVYGNGSLVNLPSIHAVRFERMDEQSPSAFGFYPIKQRYEVSSSSIADHPKAWGPYFLGVYDLSDIKHSGALFVRKVSVFVDPNIVNMLPVESLDILPDIEWSHIKISEIPDWELELEKIRAEIGK